jgi:hypothetical protein
MASTGVGLAQSGSLLAGPIVGGIGNAQDISDGSQQYNSAINAGSNLLNQGMQGADTAFNPYTSTGSTAINNEANAINTRTQAPNAAVTDNSSQNAIANYLNPSSTYSVNQADNAIQSAGIAGGAVGGGLLKALSNNANQMAQTNYNNAYSQMLQGNQLTNTQQNTNAQNTNNFTQQQIQNQSGLAGQGLQAASTNENLDLNYLNQENQNQQKIAANDQSSQNSLGSIFNNVADVTGLGATNAIPGVASALGGLFNQGTQGVSQGGVVDPTSGLINVDF